MQQQSGIIETLISIILLFPTFYVIIKSLRFYRKSLELQEKILKELKKEP
jgi:preprotein translocase subunit YajC